MMNDGKRTFTTKKITNDDIFDEVQMIRKDLQILKSSLTITRWIAGTALTLSLLVVGILIRKP